MMIGTQRETKGHSLVTLLGQKGTIQRTQPGYFRQWFSGNSSLADEVGVEETPLGTRLLLVGEGGRNKETWELCRGSGKVTHHYPHFDRGTGSSRADRTGTKEMTQFATIYAPSLSHSVLSRTESNKGSRVACAPQDS